MVTGSRRLSLATALFTVLATAECAHLPPATSAQKETATPTAETQAATRPADVLQRLRDGNARFVAGLSFERDYRAQVKETSNGQYPLASVLACIDSRSAPEIIFDQGLGELFSARIAGNFVDDEILGSLEFASKVAGSKLIVVLGHTECGAIKGACDNVKLGNLTTTLSHLRPAVDAVTDVPGPRSSKNPDFVRAVTEMNVKLTMEAIRKRSSILDGMIARGELGLVGAIYDVTTGMVTWME
ncbi:MAG TPA: carbonic anhydrase family protein [Myxococcota bacterium]|nr:carbonic anhydrase family protein [Myxococcota bacterium]